MKVMLDTNICIALIRQKSADVLQHFNSFRVGEVCISAVTLAELRSGAAKSQATQKNHTALDDFILALEIVPFNEAVTLAYGNLRATLEKKGTPIGALDTMIAAHALQLNVILATNNTREFKRVKGLTVVDWLA